VPCDAEAPSFAVEIGGVEFGVDGRDMVLSDYTGCELTFFLFT
jgi:hypothetical protein